MYFRHEGDCPNGFFFILPAKHVPVTCFLQTDRHVKCSCTSILQAGNILFPTGIFTCSQGRFAWLQQEANLTQSYTGSWRPYFIIKPAFQVWIQIFSLQADLSQLHCHPGTWCNTLLLIQNSKNSQAGGKRHRWILGFEGLDSFKRDINKILQP